MKVKSHRFFFSMVMLNSPRIEYLAGKISCSKGRALDRTINSNQESIGTANFERLWILGVIMIFSIVFENDG